MTDFGRYLLGELLWELDRFGRAIPGLTDVPREEIQVLSHVLGNEVTVRTPAGCFACRLDWTATVGPLVNRCEQDPHEAARTALR